MKKAFMVSVDGIVCITFAFSAAAAKWNAVSAAREAGYYLRRRQWPKSVKVKRAPKHDASNLNDKGSYRRCFCPEYL